MTGGEGSGLRIEEVLNHNGVMEAETDFWPATIFHMECMASRAPEVCHHHTSTGGLSTEREGSHQDWAGEPG